MLKDKLLAFIARLTTLQHLYRVTEHSRVNRMNANNLAICFAPSMMGQGRGSQVADAALQARVVETILINTLQIFDED